jgi:hypothetical protein
VPDIDYNKFEILVSTAAASFMSLSGTLIGAPNLQLPNVASGTHPVARHCKFSRQCNIDDMVSASSVGFVEAEKSASRVTKVEETTVRSALSSKLRRGSHMVSRKTRMNTSGCTTTRGIIMD